MCSSSFGLKLSGKSAFARQARHPSVFSKARLQDGRAKSSSRHSSSFQTCGISDGRKSSNPGRRLLSRKGYVYIKERVCSALCQSCGIFLPLPRLATGAPSFLYIPRCSQRRCPLLHSFLTVEDTHNRGALPRSTFGGGPTARESARGQPGRLVPLHVLPEGLQGRSSQAAARVREIRLRQECREQRRM